jgi:hypothetical protein
MENKKWQAPHLLAWARECDDECKERDTVKVAVKKMVKGTILTARRKSRRAAAVYQCAVTST